MSNAYYGRRNPSWKRSYYGSMPYGRMMDTTPACDCRQDSPNEHQHCEDMVVAMAYVPWQHMGTVFETEEAFHRGTLFPELEKPFTAGGGCRCG